MTAAPERLPSDGVIVPQRPIYSQSVFEKATLAKDHKTGSKGKASKGARPLAGGGEIEALEIESIQTVKTWAGKLGKTLPAKIELLIVKGPKPDADRSGKVFHVCCALVRLGFSDGQIHAVLSESAFGISEHVREQDDPDRAAQRAIDEARAREDAKAALEGTAREKLLAEQNALYGVIDLDGTPMVLVKASASTSGAKIELRKIHHHEFLTEPHQVPSGKYNKEGEPLTESVGSWWRKQPDRCQYDGGFIMDPDSDTGGDMLADGTWPKCWNLWKGFAVESIAGDCSQFLGHVRNIICSGDDAIYSYMIRWMASLIQRPGDIGYVLISLKGGQGTGKDVFWDALGSLLHPDHYLSTSDPELVVGRFNSALAQKILVHLVEAAAFDPKTSEKVKTLITAEHVHLEEKHKPSYQMRSCLHFGASSNRDFSGRVDPDDRRYTFIEVSPAQKNEFSYFEAIAHELGNGGREALRHHLESIDLTGWNPRDRPVTSALQDQKERSLWGLEEWIFVLGRDGVLPPMTNDLLSKAGATPSVWLEESAREYDPSVTRNALGRLLRKYGATRPPNKRLPPGFIMPTLRELREKIEATGLKPSEGGVPWGDTRSSDDQVWEHVGGKEPDAQTKMDLPPEAQPDPEEKPDAF